MAKPNGYKKYVQKQQNRKLRKDGRDALRAGREPEMVRRSSVAWLAS
jgi:hypothetical protein